MERWSNRIAVVTGASSGIGAAIAKELVLAGLIVVGLARRKELIKELRSSLPPNLRKRLHAIKCDVTQKESVKKAFDSIVKEFGGVDILVNNAGFAEIGEILTMDIASIEKTLNTNVMGIVYCTRHAFASMQSRNVDGHVVLINSILGHKLIDSFQGEMVKCNMFPSSKHATVALTEMLRQEFRELQTRVKVTSISPGMVESDMFRLGNKDVPKLAVEDISSAVLFSLSTPPHMQVHELIIKPMGEMF